MAEPSSLNSTKQKKHRKKKKKNVNVGTTTTQESLDCPQAETTDIGSRESNFDDELAWCIRQLELGLLRDKVTSSQRNESDCWYCGSQRTPMPHDN